LSVFLLTVTAAAVTFRPLNSAFQPRYNVCVFNAFSTDGCLRLVTVDRNRRSAAQRFLFLYLWSRYKCISVAVYFYLLSAVGCTLLFVVTRDEQFNCILYWYAVCFRNTPFYFLA